MKNCVFSFPIVKDFLTNVKNEISGLFWYPVFGWLYGSNILYPAGYQIKKGGIIQLDFRCITNTKLIRNVYGAGILSKYLLRTFVRGLCWTMDMQLICRLERYLLYSIKLLEFMLTIYKRTVYTAQPYAYVSACDSRGAEKFFPKRAARNRYRKIFHLSI